ncbi:MAG: EscU/YscU/HrcU family type III secretion system export apparatus switch protein, partial [Terrimicrobium sp.]
MPEDSAEEKTELPTPKKLRDARKRGQVFKSQDVNSTFVLGAAL